MVVLQNHCSQWVNGIYCQKKSYNLRPVLPYCYGSLKHKGKLAFGTKPRLLNMHVTTHPSIPSNPVPLQFQGDHPHTLFVPV